MSTDDNSNLNTALLLENYLDRRVDRLSQMHRFDKSEATKKEEDILKERLRKVRTVLYAESERFLKKEYEGDNSPENN